MRKLIQMRNLLIVCCNVAAIVFNFVNDWPPERYLPSNFFARNDFKGEPYIKQ